MSNPALWQCPCCGAKLATARGWHSCGTFDLEPLFARSEPHVRAACEALLRSVRRIGPVTVPDLPRRIPE